MSRVAAGSLIGLTLLVASTAAVGQEGSDGEIRRDPAGKTGISPYMEAVSEGEKAFVAKDIAKAKSLFEKAIKDDGEKMLAYYRLGEALLAEEKLKEAEKTWLQAKSKKGTATLEGKVMFVLADAAERQNDWKKAKNAWIAYASFLQSTPKAVGYPATASDRQKQIDRRVKDEKDGAAVKKRIAARAKERAADAKKKKK